MLLAMPGLFVFLIFTSIMRGVGDMVTPLKALFVSTLVGLVLTPALIRGWLGFPPAGVASAAYASLVAFIVTMIWLGFHLKRKGHALAPSADLLRHMNIEPAIFKAVMRIGIPTALQMVTMSLAELALLSIVNGFGSAATASYGIGNQVLGYVQFPAMSIAIAASILGAQAIGAGHTERLGLITRTGIVLNVIITGSLLLLGYLFSRSLIGIFTTDPAVVEISERMLYIILWSTLLFGASTVVSGVMRSSGTVLPPTIMAISAILFVEIPVAFVLSARIGIDGVWWAYPCTFATMLILQSTFYRLVWMRRKITRLI
jgi:putative MATE family efflux protein